MSHITFRKAALEDIPLIRHLSAKIWKTHYTPIIGEQQVDYMLNLMYSAESLTTQMIKDHAVFWLAFLSDQPLGYLSFSEKELGHYFLHKFYIDTTVHRKGIGSAFFSYLINELYQPNSLRLTVNRKNMKAINFYFKSGFVIEEVKDFDIGSGFIMEDFVMVKFFNS